MKKSTTFRGKDKNKYKRIKAQVDGKTFDSKKEAQRYCELRNLEERGEIVNLQTQVRFEVIPKFIKDGKTIERACYYVADFVYHKDGKMVVEDVKGYKKSNAYALFVIKRKLMRQKYDIAIVEI